MLCLFGCRAEPQQKIGNEAVDRVESRSQEHTIAPYLTADPSAVDGQGQAVLHAHKELLVGSVHDFTIDFTVGPAGIQAGGFILLQVSPWWGWSQPQDMDPGQPGYCSVRTSLAKKDYTCTCLTMHRFLVQANNPVPADTRLSFFYRNARVDRYAEDRELFQVFVDADGDGHAACIAKPPTVAVLPRQPERLQVNSPSQQSQDSAFDVRVTAIDAVGNRTRLPAGAYRMIVEQQGREVRSDIYQAGVHEEKITIACPGLAPGVYFFQISGPDALTGRSNVTVVHKGTPKKRLFFGDIHGHSRWSDGTGTADSYYRFAREVSGLDFAALTDHSDYGTIPLPGKNWQHLQNKTDQFNSPGEFVTFVAYEWTNWTYGHRNVYYLDKGPMFPSYLPQSDTPQELWQCLEGYEAMTIAHHVGGGPIATDWRIAPSDKEFLVELCSIHGSSEYMHCPACIYRPQTGHFVQDALQRGYKLGIMCSGDTHDGHPGQRSLGAQVTGLMAVYSPELNRKALWQAFKRRHVYGTTGAKIILNFWLAEQPMGSTVIWEADKALPMGFRVVGCDTLQQVDIFRNAERVFSEQPDSVFYHRLVEDPQPIPGESWYYLRVTQTDGQMAWSSPIWVETADS